MRIEISRRAKRELERAADWWEEPRILWDELEAAGRRLLVEPEAGRRWSILARKATALVGGDAAVAALPCSDDARVRAMLAGALGCGQVIAIDEYKIDNDAGVVTSVPIPSRDAGLRESRRLQSLCGGALQAGAGRMWR